MMLRLVLCYVIFAATVARPLEINVEKRQSSNRQMEDVQLSETGTFPVDSVATHTAAFIGVATRHCSSNQASTRPIVLQTLQVNVGRNKAFAHLQVALCLV